MDQTSDLVAAVRGLLLRDLDGLRREVEAYPDEASLWTLPPGAPNSGGTLVLHLTGNLRHFVGAVLGGTGYVRDRDAEFADRQVPRTDLLARIAATRTAVERGLGAGAPPVEYPVPVGGVRVRTDELLVHLAVHLGYHLGQVDYHRRLTTGSPVGTRNVPVTELPSARKD